MKTCKEIIHEVIEESNLPPSMKAKYETTLQDLFQGKISYKEAYNLPPETMEHMYGYAYSLYNSGKFKEASVLFAFLVTIDYREKKYMFGLAASFHMMKDYIRAIDYYFAAYFIDPKDPIPLFHLSDCYLKLDQLEYAYIWLGITMQVSGTHPAYLKLKEKSDMIQKKIEPEVAKRIEAGQAALEKKLAEQKIAEESVNKKQ